MSTKDRIDAAWAMWLASLDPNCEAALSRRLPDVTGNSMRAAFEAGWRASRKHNAAAAALAIEHTPETE